ncbi:MAG: DUF4476 domain-containing protein [Chitinophagales bacterium]|nr:DUF4476 domain-containing protein [Chitinophagales bacterium]
MKWYKYLILCSVILLNLGSAVAQKGYLYPITEVEFRQRMQQLNTRGNDEGKLQMCRVIISGKSFTSQQVKQMALVFLSDYWRYQFAAEVYPNTRDKDNFYDVYDAFTSYSAVFRLNDYVHSLPAMPDICEPVPMPGQAVIVYPLCTNYNGSKGCPLPVSDKDFKVYAASVFSQPNDDLRIKAARDLVDKVCISMAQLMSITLSLDLETRRLTFMKEAFLRVYDLENYNYAAAVLSNELYRNDWMNYCKASLTSTIVVTSPPAPVCEVTQPELDEIKATVKKQSFSSTQLALVKQILNAKKCFKCSQIKQLMPVFSFEDDKMELARFAYDYTVDKNNYYTLTDAFSFSSSKEELLNFINLKK